MKALVTIILILNVFAGYFAEAFQGEFIDCKSTYQNSHTNQDPSANGQNSEEHSGECLVVHCHFGHCASLINDSIVPLFSTDSSDSISDRTLNPFEFIFDILRPPISA